MQTAEVLEKENAFDNGKVVMAASTLLLLYLLISDNPLPLRRLNDARGVFSSIVLMGCAAGFITGFILMLLRNQNVLLTFGLLALLTVVLTVVDRLILINFL